MARPSILVVEDDGDIRSGLVSVLEDEGYAVLSAGDGEQALRMLRAGQRPFVILLDLMMPVMDGRQFRQAQLAEPALAPIPVVVLTAEPASRLAGRVPGALATLGKPFELRALLGILWNLERARERPAPAAGLWPARDATRALR